MKAKRPVHYRAADPAGLVFPCYRAEYEQWLDRKGSRPVWRTDLAKVTCRECWGQILILARQRGAK